jgi:hypothetical protein
MIQRRGEYTVKKVIANFYTWVDYADKTSWVTKSTVYSTWVMISVDDIVTQVHRLICVIYPGVEICNNSNSVVTDI